MAKEMEIAWDPASGDPRRVHNMYVRNLVTSYVNRFSELSNGVLIGLDNRDYLIYALCGRSLIETTAILRYYMLREYKPLLDRKTLVAADMKKLIDIDDRHLRGTGFDWESFVLRRYSRLRDRAKAKRGHKPSGGRGEPGAMPRQTPIGRCIDSWSKEVANVGVAYDLFCDMVHPNAGSSFLVASTGPDGLYFSKFKGDPVGKAIVETEPATALDHAETIRAVPDHADRNGVAGRRVEIATTIVALGGTPTCAQTLARAVAGTRAHRIPEAPHR